MARQSDQHSIISDQMILHIHKSDVCPRGESVVTPAGGGDMAWQRD